MQMTPTTQRNASLVGPSTATHGPASGMPLSILDEDNLMMIDDVETMSPAGVTKAANRKYNYSNTAKTNTLNRKANIVPPSIGGMRTVANKLPDSHLSKVPLDKLLSYTTGGGKNLMSRLSDLQSSNPRSITGPGSLFDSNTSKMTIHGDSGKSPNKVTPMKGTKKSDYSSSGGGGKLLSNLVRGLKDDTIEEKKGETSRSNSLNAEEKSPTSSSSEETPSVGDEGKSAGNTTEEEHSDFLTSSDFQTQNNSNTAFRNTT